MQKKTIAIINGPNLNLTGIREPDIYGALTFKEYIDNLSDEFPEIELVYFQSNIEGEIIDRIQAVGFTVDGIILNAGGYSHTSVAIADAVNAIKCPVIEVHMSNIWARESFRHHSILSSVVQGVIAGFGMGSYRLALLYLLGR